MTLRVLFVGFKGFVKMNPRGIVGGGVREGDKLLYVSCETQEWRDSPFLTIS